jgi:hypothetical protein
MDLTDVLEKIQDIEDRKANAENLKGNIEHPSEIQKKAMEILKTGNPWKYYIDTWKKSYGVVNNDTSIGDMVLCVIGNTAISNTMGAHLKAGGASGFGKSIGITRMFRLFPHGKTVTGSLSAKALFYKEDMSDGTVVYIDDIDLSDTAIHTTIKQSTSSYQDCTVHTTVKSAKAVEHTIPARIGWILSSVDNFDDEQLDSRFAEVEVSNGIDKQIAIYEKQKGREFEKGSFFEVDEDTQICRCMWNILEDAGLYEIRIPYVNAITWSDIKHPRSFTLFTDLIRGVTLFNIKQREKVGKFYISTVGDFECARDIYQRMAHTNVNKMSSKEVAILSFVQGKGRVPRTELVKYLGSEYGLKQANIIQIVHGKRGDGGLLNKVTGFIAEEDVNERGSPCIYYSYTGSINADGTVEAITLDDNLVSAETEKWNEQIQ